MILNYIIYKAIKRNTFRNSPSASRTRRELYIATILITIVTLFGACHILKCFINMLELVSVLSGKASQNLKLLLILFFSESNLEQTLGQNMNLVVSLSHLLITVNCSANFSIYCYKVCLGFIVSFADLQFLLNAKLKNQKCLQKCMLQKKCN